MSAVAESTPRGSYTLDSVLEILEDQGVLGADQGADIRSRQGRIAAKVIKDREKIWGKSKRSGVDDVSPAEIIAASGVSGDAGVLTLDQVMEAVAMVIAMSPRCSASDITCQQFWKRLTA